MLMLKKALGIAIRAIADPAIRDINELRYAQK